MRSNAPTKRMSNIIDPHVWHLRSCIENWNLHLWIRNSIDWTKPTTLCLNETTKQREKKSKNWIRRHAGRWGAQTCELYFFFLLCLWLKQQPNKRANKAQNRRKEWIKNSNSLISIRAGKFISSVFYDETIKNAKIFFVEGNTSRIETGKMRTREIQSTKHTNTKEMTEMKEYTNTNTGDENEAATASCNVSHTTA